MRKPIGWIDRTWPGGRREVRVEFFAGDLRWRFRTPQDEEWQDGEPTEDNWNDLEAKIRELIQRGHLYDRELTLVQQRRPGGHPAPIAPRVSQQKQLKIRRG